MSTFTYKASPTCAAFHRAPVEAYDYKGIRGGVASGKSVACCLDIFLKSNDQTVAEIDEFVRLTEGRKLDPKIIELTGITDQMLLEQGKMTIS